MYKNLECVIKYTDLVCVIKYKDLVCVIKYKNLVCIILKTILYFIVPSGFHIGDGGYRYPVNGYNGYYMADMDIKMDPELMEASSYHPGQTPSPMGGYSSPSSGGEYSDYGQCVCWFIYSRLYISQYCLW